MNVSDAYMHMIGTLAGDPRQIIDYVKRYMLLYLQYSEFYHQALIVKVTHANSLSGNNGNHLGIDLSPVSFTF